MHMQHVAGTACHQMRTHTLHNGRDPGQDPKGAHHALCEKQANPLPPMATVTTVTTVFPDTGLPQTPTHSENSDNDLKHTMFHTENARMLSVFSANLLFSPCGRMLPWSWVVFRVVTGQLIYYRALCLTNAAPWPAQGHGLALGHCAQATDTITNRTTAINLHPLLLAQPQLEAGFG